MPASHEPATDDISHFIDGQGIHRRMPSTLMLLSNPYRPDPRVLTEGRALQSEGIEVNLISWDRDMTRPIEANEDGIRVVRLGPRTPTRSPKKMLTGLPRFWWKALLRSKSVKFDVVHAHDLDTLPLGRLISKLSGKPLLYDAHELYARMVEGDIGRASSLIWVLEKWCASQADAAITVSNALASELPPSKSGRAAIVATSQDPSVLEGVDVGEIRKKYGLTEFVVSYLGSLEPGRFVEETVSSFSAADGVTVLVAGSGTLAEKVTEMAKSNPAVRYIGVVPTDEAMKLTLASDLVVAMMDPSNHNNVIGTPGKIVNAMAAGRPVITTEGLEIAEKVRAAGCGIVVPWDRAKFREAVMRAKANRVSTEEIGRKGRAFYDQNFSWNCSKQELLRAYQTLLRRSDAALA